MKFFRKKLIFNLGLYLKFLILLAIVLMLLPLVLYPLPKYVLNGDVTQVYKFTLLMSKNIKNIAYSEYPKFFHLSSLFFSKIFSIPIGASIYIVTAVFSILFPIVVYKLALKITKHKEVSLLAAFLSLTIGIYTSPNFGITLPIPQTISLTFLTLSVLFFISDKPILAGIFLGLHYLTHPSWPITFVFLLVYSILTFLKRKDIKSFQPLIISTSVAILLVSPITFYITKNSIHAQYEHLTVHEADSMTMISLFSYPFVIWPPLIILFAFYSSYKLFKKSTMNLKFLIINFLLTIVGTQAYFLEIPKLIFLGLLFSTDRLIFFSLPFIAILCAISLFHVFEQKKKFLIILCLFVLLFSMFFYIKNIQNFNLMLNNNDLDMLNFLEGNSIDKNIFYNPSKTYQQEWALIHMSGNNPLDFEFTKASYLGFLAVEKYDPINIYNFSYVLERKNDPYINEFVNNQKNNLNLIYSNKEYNLYEVKNPTSKEHEELLVNYLTVFSGYFNQHPRFQNSSKSSTILEVGTIETNESVCVLVGKKMEIAECTGKYDFKIIGNKAAIKELFTTMWGASDFVYRFLWFYDHGKIFITSSNHTNVDMIVSNNLLPSGTFSFNLQDVNTHINIDTKNHVTRLRIEQLRDQRGVNISLRFISKSLKWIQLNSIYSYPNIIFGIIYAIFTL